MAAPKLFLDASVLIAAAGSTTGGSSMILELGRRGVVRLFDSKLILLEAERDIREKMPTDALLRLYAQIGTANLILVKPPNVRELAEVRSIVAEKDAHVLASALKGHANVLLTLDRKHLLRPEVLAASPVPIQTPGEFLQQFVSKAKENH